MRTWSLFATVLVAVLALPRLVSAQAPAYPPEPPPGAQDAPPPRQLDPAQPDAPRPFPPQPRPPSDGAPQPYPPQPSAQPPRRQPVVVDELAANTGFQLAVEDGPSFPLGKAEGSANLSDLFSAEFPLVFHLGFKPIKNLGFGGYLGLALGGSGAALSSPCSDPDVKCIAVGYRLGLEAQLSLLPAGRVDPYVGLGAGVETSGVSGTRGGTTVLSVGLTGLELARVTVGADYRVSRTVGIGPFLNVAVGRYYGATQDFNKSSASRDIADTALHAWLTIGVRLTLFP